MSRNPAASISALLSYYSFDLGGYPLEQIVQGWLEEYPPKWAIAAVVEAIFQGRYKVASVDNILLNWYLNGRPQHHFDNEFADLVCSKLFKAIPSEPIAVNSPAIASTPSNTILGQSSIATVEVPFKKKLSPSTDQPETYSLNPVQAGARRLNPGIQRWLRFTTKLR